MNQQRPPLDPEHIETHDDPIARVLKFAGARPQPDPDRKAEFKRALRTEWRRAIDSEPRATSHTFGSFGASGTFGTFGRPVRNRRAVAIAASLAVAAGITWMLPIASWLPLRHPQSPVATQIVGRIVRSEGVVRTTAGEDVRANTVLDTGATGRIAVALNPGISLRMDVDSRIVMAGERVVRLERGAVYIDARADKSGSVLVRTPHGDVRDIGTQFEVRARGSAFGVRVREGEILINRGGAEMTARAGEGLHLDRDGRYVRSTIPIFGPEWAWTSAIAPRFQLEGATVQQFLDWVAREQGWRWRFADNDTARLAAGIVTHGSLEGYTPEEALAIVLPTCGLSFVRNRDEVVVGFTRESSSRD